MDEFAASFKLKTVLSALILLCLFSNDLMAYDLVANLRDQEEMITQQEINKKKNHMFSMFRNKKRRPLTLHLNMRMQPIHRHQYEEDITEVLEKDQMGEIMGGGTMLDRKGVEIESCDIEIDLFDKKDNLDRLVDYLRQCMLAKGSVLICEDTGDKIDVGSAEGLAFYFDCTSLPDNLQASADFDKTVDDMINALRGVGVFCSFLENENWVAVYFYGPSFEEMKQCLLPIADSNPLCRKSRIEQIV